MIILDYSQIALSNIIVQKLNDENMIRHMVLNSISMYNKRYRKEYGQMVICADGMNTWRRQYFPEYKGMRRKGKEESTMDWNEIFRIVNLIREEIQENLPYKVMHMEGCEADDIIGALAIRTQEFGQGEPVMIVSSDKDFIQLQKHSFVKQYSPVLKKFVSGIDPHLYIREHVLKGDRSDGVPNFLSPDNTFVDELRQKPLSKKKLETWIDLEPSDFCSEEMMRNYQRNKTLIDLECIPSDLKATILEDYQNAEHGDRTKLLNYFINKRLKNLMNDIGDF